MALNSPIPPEEAEPPKFRTWWIIALLAIWLGIGFAPKLDCNPGTFGDMFGMVNSLFSGLAFVGLIHTIRLQMHEISLQRQDLKLTRNELERSANAQAESAKALALQVIISSITAQLATALQRREKAGQNELRMGELKSKGVRMVSTPDGECDIDSKLREMAEAGKNLTSEIDKLSKRLQNYDKLLCDKLNLIEKCANSPVAV